MPPAPPRGLAIRLLGVGDEAAMISAFSALEGWETPELAGARRFLGDAGTRLLVAQLEGRAGGALIAHVLPRSDGEAMLLIYDLGVDAAQRRRGIGAALVREAEQLAQEADAAEMWLVTNRSNGAAMALYTALGGVTVADDDVVVEWRLARARTEQD